MTTRRDVLARSAQVAALLAGAGLLPAAHAAYNAAAFDARTVADAVKALGAGAPVESRDVTVTGPDIAENGATVPLGVATTLAGVRRMLILVDKNPAVLSAAFDVGDAVESSFALRIKMNQSSNVYAVALMADGRVLYAHKDVKVTLGGCAG